MNELPITELPLSDLPIIELPLSDLPMTDLPLPGLGADMEVVPLNWYNYLSSNSIVFRLTIRYLEYQCVLLRLVYRLSPAVLVLVAPISMPLTPLEFLPASEFATTDLYDGVGVGLSNSPAGIRTYYGLTDFYCNTFFDLLMANNIITPQSLLCCRHKNTRFCGEAARFCGHFKENSTAF
ncbi:hypothetical protein JCM33374_g1470 [Metschnikowia sp. JCM 33374]|nr:hypothetical protein JCM33374_g1470 [Metschnikowia sp. JCM 33374]